MDIYPSSNQECKNNGRVSRERMWSIDSSYPSRVIVGTFQFILTFALLELSQRCRPQFEFFDQRELGEGGGLYCPAAVVSLPNSMQFQVCDLVSSKFHCLKNVNFLNEILAENRQDRKVTQVAFGASRRRHFNQPKTGISEENFLQRPSVWWDLYPSIEQTYIENKYYRYFNCHCF